ncbi:unnamed protein product [Lactuca saligna]|uniref:NB-ARC domain-containing protein n=1 Tax=Lactuca saligna TaxID=75948 RepID=A0AA35V4H5_LACSI|nr:unnamed protein product [Lactuca saligna]
MGGVGKTTMMKKLRQTVVEKKMFSYFVMAVVGENPDINAIQESIASYLGIQLKDQAKQVRVDELRQGFEAKLKGGESKFLVILDDVWKLHQHSSASSPPMLIDV